VGATAATVVAAVAPPQAASRAATAGDVVGSLSGPTSGSVGDTLTYTVTATNRGPDAATVQLAFAFEKAHAFELVDADPSCPVSDTPDQTIVRCDFEPIAVGETQRLVVHVKVVATSETAVDGFANPDGTDPDTTNNAISWVAFPSRPSPPPPPPPPAPVAPPYSFAADLPPGEQYILYSQTTLAGCPSLGCPVTVQVTAGALPPGVTVDTGGALTGKPFTPGTYTFTLTATPNQYWNYLPISHEYTLVVDPFANPDSDGADTPTVVLPRQGLTPGATNPAVRQSTIRQTICAARWLARARPPTSFTAALKLRQMKQYGETGRPQGFVEDHLIPLELGGAPRSPRNLWPEPYAQARRADAREAALERKVCRRTLSLAAARRQIVAFKRANG
jgi:hypothetical protein